MLQVEFAQACAAHAAGQLTLSLRPYSVRSVHLDGNLR
jgi:hypothetical protein